MRRYKMTGRGSLTRWEHPDGRPVVGVIPPEAVLVRYEAGSQDELLASDEFVAANEHMGLIPILDRNRIEVRSEAAAPAQPEEIPAAPAAAAKPHGRGRKHDKASEA